MENYYEIIGVSINSDYNTIKSAYLAKVKEYHPDVYVGDKLFAEKMMAKINEAYNTLKDEELRQTYNNTLIIKKEKQKNSCCKLKSFFVNIKNNIKKFFIWVVGGIKNIFSSNKTELTQEQKERKRLNIIILIQTLLIILLIILVTAT